MKIENVKFKITAAMLLAIILLALPTKALAQTNNPFITEQQTVTSGFGESVASFFSRIFTLNNPVSLHVPKTNFTRGETPKFLLTVPQHDTSNIGQATTDQWNKAPEEIAVDIIRTDQKDATIAATIKKVNEGTFELVVPKQETLTAGKYTLAVSAKESIIYNRTITQDFTWGVLAFNTNKSTYTPGEKAKLSFGVVDDHGHTICYAKIEVSITNPSNQQTTVSTENGSIHKSPECRGDSFTLLPDYSTEYQTTTSGTYQMHVTATTPNGTHSMDDYFMVQDSVPFDVERTQFPTRIYPRDTYEVTLTIKANQDYNGPITEYVPQSFGISHISSGGQAPEQELLAIDAKSWVKLHDDLYTLGNTIPATESAKTGLTIDSNHIPVDSIFYANKKPVPVTWNMQLENGKSYTLKYTIHFPLISPEFYLIGPLQIGSFEETRQWQIAADAAKCWDNDGGDNKYSTQTNWASDTLPASTDTITFGSPACSSNANMTIDSVATQPNGSGGGIDMQSGYTGTITQSVAISFGSNGYTQAAGTYNGGTTTTTVGAITSDATRASFTLTGGTHGATTGSLIITKDITILRPATFTNNSGTVDLRINTGTKSTTITGSATYFNFIWKGGGSSNSVWTTTLASGTTMTVTNTLTLNETNTGAGNNHRINGPGRIEAQGNITITSTTTLNNGFRGNAVVEVNGTGDQTITGNPTADTDTKDIAIGNMPSIHINKPSGTLTFVNKVGINGGWTYDSGTVAFGTSTIIFAPEVDGADVFAILRAPATPFNNVTFKGAGNSGSSVFISIAANTKLNISGNLLFREDNISRTNNLDGPGQIIVSGNVTSTASTPCCWASTSSAAGARITMAGTTTWTPSTTASNFPRGQIFITGTATLAAAYTVDSSQTIYVQNGGTLDLAGNNLTLSRLVVESGGTLKLQGGETLSITTTLLREGSTVNYNGTVGYTTLSMGYTYSNLTFSSASATAWDINAQSTLTTTGNLTISANNTLTAPTTLTIGGNFANSGTFTHNSKTVVFNTPGLDSTISGNTTFYNFTCTTAGKRLTFTAGSTTTIASGATMTITGSAGAPISLVSTTNASAWNLTNTGATMSVDYALIRDSNASASTTATHSRSEGGNTNWTTSGDYYNGTNNVIINGGTTINSGTTIQ